MANRYPTVTSPRGVMIYPHLTEPDTKFVKPDGEYHTKLALEGDSQATIDFIEKLEGILAKYIEDNSEELTPAQIKKAGRMDLYEEEVDDEGEETGRYIFKFKLKAKVKTKTKEWDQKPRLFDSQAQPIAGDVNPWTGSEGKVSVEVFPYYMGTTKSFGLSLRCKAVQVLKLVSGGGASADDYGFGAEEDGFVDESTAGAAGFAPEAPEDDEEF